MAMNLFEAWRPALLNAWLMCVPVVSAMACISVRRKDVARRMADMTGYNAREKVTVGAASLVPYAFIAETAFVPFGSGVAALAVGFAVYFLALIGLALTLRVLISTPSSQQFTNGPYQVSRHPLYVCATAVFTSICIVTGSPVLTLTLIPAVWLQHLMILAEERVCGLRYGPRYEDYCRKVPRYFAWPGRRA
jgi:protein-S-isoprenylcysteine O-methyltransferase Ste14